MLGWIYNLYDLKRVAVQRRVPDADNFDSSALIVVHKVVPEAPCFSLAPVSWACDIRQEPQQVRYSERVRYGTARALLCCCSAGHMDGYALPFQ